MKSHRKKQRFPIKFTLKKVRFPIKLNLFDNHKFYIKLHQI